MPGAAGSKDRPDPSHLPIVGGGIDRDIGGLSESGQAGEKEDGQSGEAELLWGVRADAYRYHFLDNF